ncbi:hypothetical protein [Rugosibacter aromaticivorans]|uniref:hypothetical protein n=1 Tax=Rugosibacter aromaticivorans TaxID=1565605 RepID=UPI00120481EB|nr:hypothetical protein [Rugosibacter aromaticivorans]TBR15601.1 MAG: hypothetical protein EPO43_03790 [Rugosibacter sp.]
MLVQPAVRIIGILFFSLAAGCAAVKEVPPSVMTQTGPVVADLSLDGSNQDRAVAAEPLRSEAREEATVALAAPPAGLRQPVMISGEAIGVEPVAGAPTQPWSRRAAKAAPPLAKTPAKVFISPVTIDQPRKNEDTLPVARKLEPPLDVAALKARLRDTNAIGVFTKLALKNQMDDLLKQFRAHYQSGQKTSVASLRQPYDMLVLKVLALVQNSDPSLARTISGSREAIWGILADPVKFNSIT